MSGDQARISRAQAGAAGDAGNDAMWAAEGAARIPAGERVGRVTTGAGNSATGVVGSGVAGSRADSSKAAVAPEVAARAEAALRAFAGESGRSVAVRVVTGDLRWAVQVAGDELRPAASLLKLPLAMAVEQAMGRDPRGPEVGGDLWARAEGGRAEGGALATAVGAAGKPAAGALTAAVRVGELTADWPEPTVLRALDPARSLQAGELLRFMVSCSDGPSTRWLLDAVGIEAVEAAITDSSCTATEAGVKPGAPGGPLVGTTTANDALKLLAAALDQQRHPITAGALADSTLNSRIPLGVQRSDIAVAHKTGTLFGVAHDVAMLDVPGGQVWLAFLCEAQHDTLVSGYEMGLCTQEVLAAFGLGVIGSRSADGG